MVIAVRATPETADSIADCGTSLRNVPARGVISNSIIPRTKQDPTPASLNRFNGITWVKMWL
jgi:hypothetical protein